MRKCESQGNVGNDPAGTFDQHMFYGKGGRHGAGPGGAAGEGGSLAVARESEYSGTGVRGKESGGDGAQNPVAPFVDRTMFASQRKLGAIRGRMLPGIFCGDRLVAPVADGRMAGTIPTVGLVISPVLMLFAGTDPVLCSNVRLETAPAASQISVEQSAGSKTMAMVYVTYDGGRSHIRPGNLAGSGGEPLVFRQNFIIL